MGKSVIELGNGFWNIRGSYRVGGVLEVGTQASLVQRKNGHFVLLDSCQFSTDVQAQIGRIMGDDGVLEAIINLHPFHTLHVAAAHALFPQAQLFGSARHRDKLPQLPWQPESVEKSDMQDLFAEDFDFSVPEGVDFISDDENVHFSSVLAYHRNSKTIHSDDTLCYIRLAGLLSFTGLAAAISFHPTLPRALQKRAGAADQFRQWAEAMIQRWGDAENLCAAHNGVWTAEANSGDSLAVLIRNALARTGHTLEKHSQQFDSA